MTFWPLEEGERELFANCTMQAEDCVWRETESNNTGGGGGSKFNLQGWKTSAAVGETQFTELPHCDVFAN